MIKKTFFIIFFFTMFNNSFASTKFDIIENFRKIDASAKFSCWGGENIEKQEVDVIQTLDKLSFLGFWEVLKNTQTIINNFRI